MIYILAAILVFAFLVACSIAGRLYVTAAYPLLEDVLAEIDADEKNVGTTA